MNHSNESLNWAVVSRGTVYALWDTSNILGYWLDGTDPLLFIKQFRLLRMTLNIEGKPQANKSLATAQVDVQAPEKNP